MAELSRFGILADDLAGTPLSAMPQGTLLQLLLEAALRPGDPVAIVSLLKHPLARFGLERGALISAIEALELLALRGGVAGGGYQYAGTPAHSPTCRTGPGQARAAMAKSAFA
ncbi:hypothetical protein ACOJBO_21750 [Rhizobium beringeri]